MAQRIASNLVKSQTGLIGIRSLSTKNFGDVHSNKLHLAVKRDFDYPEAKLALPPNVDANETTRFSPLRNRDITASEISVHASQIDVTLEQQSQEMASSAFHDDPHLNSYDRQTPVNLSSSIQSLVPEPFSPPKDDPIRSSYLSFPGGSWGQQTKYLSHELNSAHYTQLRQEMRSDWSAFKGSDLLAYSRLFAKHSCLLNNHAAPVTTNFQYQKRFISKCLINFNENQSKDTAAPKETGRTKLKKAFKEYGATVVVFHVCISLVSLGIFYTLVSSGLDVVALLEKLNLADKAPKFAENASTFLIAYAVHKVFAPARISITLFSTPFIVRFLRNKKILK